MYGHISSVISTNPKDHSFKKATPESGYLQHGFRSKLQPKQAAHDLAHHYTVTGLVVCLRLFSGARTAANNHNHSSLISSQLPSFLQCTVVISLLQPPPETYDLFDDIMLLAEGERGCSRGLTATALAWRLPCTELLRLPTTKLMRLLALLARCTVPVQTEADGYQLHDLGQCC